VSILLCYHRAIDTAIAQNLPLEGLTANPNDYKDGGRLAALVGRKPKADDPRSGANGHK
jgi:hypothetical protein